MRQSECHSSILLQHKVAYSGTVVSKFIQLSKQWIKQYSAYHCKSTNVMVICAL